MAIFGRFDRRPAERGSRVRRDVEPPPLDEPYTVEYYYTARWGHADEFIRLYRKNHYPILERQVETGRFLSVSAVTPRYHMTEDARWDYRVTIVFESTLGPRCPAEFDPVIETALKRDRVVAIAALTLVTVLAWAWTLSAARMPDGEMTMHGGMPVGARAAWSAGHAVLMFAMWWIMMVAMMLPSAAPFVILGLSLHRREGGTGRATAAVMASGYLGVWGLFSVGATVAQWGLDAAGLLTAASIRTGPALAGAILVAAGIYQLTPAKRACLKQCRSPVQFVVEHWHPGVVGAVRMGVAHGTYCVGCCWMLMGVLFAVGVMNPFWIGALALWVLVEKWTRYGDRLRYAAGALLMISGAFILLRAFEAL